MSMDEQSEAITEYRTKNLATGMIWNSVGTSIYYLCQWLLTVAVVRISGYENAGILALAMASTNIFCSIGLFGIRPYQISDYQKKFDNSTYIASRLITSSIVIIACLIFSIINQYSIEQILCLNAYMLFRVVECVVDVYHGVDQIHFKLDVIGKSFTIRGVLFLVSFVMVLHFTNNLLWSILSLFFVTAIVVLIYDIPNAAKIDDIHISFDLKNIRLLLLSTAPLMVNSLLATVIAFIPKGFLESYWGSEQMGIYSSITSPILFLQIFVSYIYNPLVPMIGKYHDQKDYKRINRLVIGILCVTILIAFITIVGTNLFGAAIVTVLFGAESQNHVNLLIPAVICSILTSVTWFGFSLLTAIRKMNVLIISSLVACVVSLVISPIMVKLIGMNGVTYAFTIAQGVQSVIMYLYYFGFSYMQSKNKLA